MWPCRSMRKKEEDLGDLFGPAAELTVSVAAS